MKTIKDAYEALKGDLSGTDMYSGEETFVFYHRIDDEFGTSYQEHSKYQSKEDRYHICTVEEFKNYHANYTAINDDMQPVSPIYTQTMKDNGELPPVGSRFIDVELGDNGTEVEAIAHDLPLKRVVYKSASALEDCEYFGATIDECKVITLPIVLTNGEFYSFKYNSDSYRGIYSKREGRFIFADGHVMVSYCKSIQLLEVKI